MKLPQKLVKPFVALCLAAGLAARVRIIARPIGVLTNRYLADDFFYYLNIAFHLASGNGSTVDGGITCTNGYNPLYAWLLTAAFWLGATKTGAVRIGLLLQALSVVTAGWLGAAHCLRKGAPRAAILFAGVLGVSPFFLWPTLNGFELGVALAAAFVALEVWDRETKPWAAGIACGVAFLARADCLAIVLVFLLAYAWHRRWREGSIVLVSFLVVIAPFSLWSAAKFGLLLPGSAVQKTHLRSAASIAASARTFALLLPNILVSNRVLERVPKVVVWALSGVAALACLRGVRWLGGPRTLLAAAMTGAYVVITDGSEPGALKRYLFSALVLLLLAATLEIDRGDWSSLLHWRRAAPFEPLAHWAVIVMVLWAESSDCLLLLRWDRATKPVPSFVGLSSTIAGGLGAYVAGDRRIAAFDSGALGYFSPTPVVNLDGLVNQDIVRVRRECKNEPYEACLLRYLREKNITVLVGCTAFGWTSIVPDWGTWTRLYESQPLPDGSNIVVLRVPDSVSGHGE